MAALLQPYPETRQERDEWILQRRASRAPVSAAEPYAYLTETERFADGSVGQVATIFLTNRECPWRCVMCDLWRNTLTEPVRPGDIPRQIEFALQRLAPARQVKLYNSGSFFDTGAIPKEDYPAIINLMRGFERVIVECHPALVTDRCVRFRDQLGCDLEVAMGLETSHPQILAQLNKRMTLSQYADAAAKLSRNQIALRSFVLVRPPFMSQSDTLPWARRSIDFAQDCGATAVSLIPTRGGNGAMEALAAMGQFAPPSVQELEEAFAYGIGRARGRTFVDLWDFERMATCTACVESRKTRLQRMNLSQTAEPKILCPECKGVVNGDV